MSSFWDSLQASLDATSEPFDDSLVFMSGIEILLDLVDFRWRYFESFLTDNTCLVGFKRREASFTFLCALICSGLVFVFNFFLDGAILPLATAIFLEKKSNKFQDRQGSHSKHI